MRALFVTIFLSSLFYAFADEPKKKTTSGHPFSWPFMTWEKMKPYGGTSKGADTTLDTSKRQSYSEIYANGISKKEQDRRAILALTGDFRVSFDFIETSGSTEEYTPQRPYFSWATERAFVIQESENFISIQHILVMEFMNKDGEVEGPFTMKHWRQDWSFEATTVTEFLGSQHWQKFHLKGVEDTWIQKVYQVDDSPRYQAIGKWSHHGGLSTFQTEEFWRPLPRREFSVRDDYNVLAGTHQIIVNPTGWLHLQNNRKLVVEKGAISQTLATELGAVRYQQLSSPDLSIADSYWGKTELYWEALRAKWKQVLKENASFSLKKKVDNKRLFMHHFEQAGELEGESTPPVREVIEKGLKTIESFLDTNETSSQINTSSQ